jgi:hypothetical protein
MHTLEPHYKWRMYYVAAEDEKSPFFGKVYSEFEFSSKIYNYFIHPQWDDFGSETLFAKILFANYIDNYCIVELIGEWNDCLYNDVMLLKQGLIDRMQEQGISKFILICENVLNFHASDDCYYEEWFEDVNEEQGWICFTGLNDHVAEEMTEYGIQNYVQFGFDFNVNWRPHKPELVYEMIRSKIED